MDEQVTPPPVAIIGGTNDQIRFTLYPKTSELVDDVSGEGEGVAVVRSARAVVTER